MPSEHRLHPTSVVLGFVTWVRNLAVPGAAMLVTGGAAGWDLQTIVGLALLPAALLSLGRYLTFRYRYDPGELVIRSGLFFRNERHIPYERIQNLDARQGVAHRVLRVVMVRVETGGGSEPEAVMNALPWPAVHEMRQRVFASRAQPDPAGEPGPREGQAAEAAPAAERPRELLLLTPADLVICGLIRNRGVVLLGAFVGAAYESGIVDRYVSRFVPAVEPFRDAVGETLKGVVTRGELPLASLAALLGFGLAAGVVLLALSVGWAFVRLGGFRLSLRGDDLSMEYGLLDRVASTVPRRRIQAIGVQRGLIHRWTGRVSVRVETAAGVAEEEGADTRRTWMAPVLRSADLREFLAALLPGFDLAGVAWEGVAPGARGRASRQALLLAAVPCVPCVVWPGWWSAVVPPLMVLWALVAAHQRVKHLGWAESGGAVCFRRGWLWRTVSVVPTSRIQVVSTHESPFDRRTRMARVRVDTAGASDETFRVSIPFLERHVAGHLRERLASLSASSG